MSPFHPLTNRISNNSLPYHSNILPESNLELFINQGPSLPFRHKPWLYHQRDYTHNRATLFATRLTNLIVDRYFFCLTEELGKREPSKFGQLSCIFSMLTTDSFPNFNAMFILPSRASPPPKPQGPSDSRGFYSQF